MITPELVNYIRARMSEGASKEIIFAELHGGGWTDKDITDGLEVVAGRSSLAHTSAPWGKILIVLLLAALLAGGYFAWSGGYFDRFFTAESTDVSLVEQAETTDNPAKATTRFNWDEAFAAIPDEENSAFALESFKYAWSSEADSDFLKEFSRTFSATSTVSIAKARAVVKNNQKLLSDFEEMIKDKRYQCPRSIMEQGTCSLNNIRAIPPLKVLNTLVLLADGKTAEAEKSAWEIVEFGEKLSADTPVTLFLLVGWPIQKSGYITLLRIREKQKTLAFPLTESDTQARIKKLRAEHTRAMEFEYAGTMERIDFITSADNPVPFGYNEEAEGEIVAVYREAANAMTWKPDIIKKWVSDSHKITLENIERACGSSYRESKIDIGFDPEATEDSENYVGKTLYETMYASFDSLNDRRCDIEAIIEKL